MTLTLTAAQQAELSSLLNAGLYDNWAAVSDAVTPAAGAPVDVGFIAWALSLVFLMQAGFACLEAGYVREKNQQAILFKQFFDITAGGLMWWMCGAAFSVTDNGEENIGSQFIGGSGFFPSESSSAGDKGYTYIAFVFGWTFCATAATIVSGAVAERVKLIGYAVIAVWLTAFVYPVVVAWTWGYGFLYDMGYSDFAGSGIVHELGGFAALTAAAIMGPRRGRFDGSGKMTCIGRLCAFQHPGLHADRQFPLGTATDPMFITLGCFILWFGWFGFNGGSALYLTAGGSLACGRACATTMLAASAGGVAITLLGAIIGYGTATGIPGTDHAHRRNWSVSDFANGVLGGLVGITAGCGNVDLWASVLIGATSGFVVLGCVKLEQSMGIDDVVGAWPVHGMAGAWGVFLTGLFHIKNGAFYAEGEYESCLGANIVGLLVIAAWAVGTTALVSVPLDLVGLLREPEYAEVAGVDIEFEQINRKGVAQGSGHWQSSAMMHMSSAGVSSPAGSATKTAPA